MSDSAPHTPLRYAALAVVALGVAEVLWTITRPGYLPHDYNAIWLPVPMFAQRLAAGHFASSLGALILPGGWWQVVVAAALAVRAEPWVFGLVTMLPWVLLLAGVARLWGATAAGLLLLCEPMARSGLLGWVHVPEVALLVGVMLSLRDQRGRAVAVFGALALMLRPSAALWLALLLPSVWKQQRWALLGWGIAALVPLRVLGDYATGKVGVRDRYADAVPSLWQQLGEAPLWFLAVGMLAVVAFGKERRLWLGAWVVLPPVIATVSGAGLDNFPVFYLALAILADQTLRRLPKGDAVSLCIVTLTLLSVLGRVRTPEPNPAVPLLAEHCPGRCRVVVEDGLFRPGAEDPGALELLLLGQREVTVLPLHHPGALNTRADVLVTWHCQARADRFPESTVRAQQVRNQAQLREVARVYVEGCTGTWEVR